MENEIVKICKKHGKLTSEQVRADKDGRYIQLRCRLCRSITKTTTYMKNREKNLAYAKKWKSENKERINAQVRADRKINPEKHRRWSAANRLKFGERRNTIEKARRYGLTLDQYNELHDKQKGLCAICFKEEKTIDKRKGKIKTLCLDHDHETNKLREFLCDACNKGLGHLRDSIETIESALKYLKKHKIT